MQEIVQSAADKPSTAMQSVRKSHHQTERPQFESIALVLQGGGALGAFQGGVYQALAEANLTPDWVAGISIGAINAALIAGNAPEARVDKLRAFWEHVTTPVIVNMPDIVKAFWTGDMARGYLNQFNAWSALMRGAPNFFEPRPIPPYLHPPGTIEATSYYDTTALRGTLEGLVDFDRINAGEMRFSVGAVNVRTGNFAYFDTKTHTIRPEHILASGALPPGFPPVEIEGELYWDGGLVSNTPLQWVVSGDSRHVPIELAFNLDRGKTGRQRTRRENMLGPDGVGLGVEIGEVAGANVHGTDAESQDTLAFQVDLWSARGEAPHDMPEVIGRQKEIQYSSRTRAGTDQFKTIQRVRAALADLFERLPPSEIKGEDIELLRSIADRKVYKIVQLIYRSKHYERQSKDYEFSRLSMQDHWQAGYNDAIRTLRHPEALERPTDRTGCGTFDIGVDGRD
jgi:NTE family protein